MLCLFFFQAEDGIRALVRSRGLGDVYKRQDVALADAGIWKAWALLSVAEATRMGVAPLATAQLHVLLYLANTMAQLFDVTRVRGRVLKRGAYPFYPDVQRELDRLAFNGVLKIERVDFGPKGHLSAHYGPVSYTHLRAHETVLDPV